MKKWLILTGFVAAGIIGIVSVAHAVTRCTIEVIEYECSCGGPPCEKAVAVCQSI